MRTGSEKWLPCESLGRPTPPSAKRWVVSPNSERRSCASWPNDVGFFQRSETMQTTEPCWRCGGKPRGVASPKGGWVTCPVCHGTGELPAPPAERVQIVDRRPDDEPHKILIEG